MRARILELVEGRETYQAPGNGRNTPAVTSESF